MSPLNPEQKRRLEALQKPWCDNQLLQELYGLNLSQDSALMSALRSWSQSLRKPGLEVMKHGGHLVHRHYLETFFQVRKLLPFKQAAARLGMDEESLKRVRMGLEPRGFYFASLVSEQLVSEPQLRDIVQFSADLAHRIFGNHDDFCRRLHEALAKELGIQVNALHCITSETLHEKPVDYAYEFDVITLEPVGLRYQVWLDFKKPLHLKPDCCATKTYWENQELLRDLLFAGEKPEIPPALATAGATSP